MIFLTGFLIYAVLRGVMDWNNNRHSQVTVVKAGVISKKEDEVQHYDAQTGALNGVTSSYYVFFQVEDGGEVLRFHVSLREFRKLSEGDRGELKYQGSRFIGFEKKPINKL